MAGGSSTSNRRTPTGQAPHQPTPSPTAPRRDEIVIRVQRIQGAGVHLLSPTALPQHLAPARNPLELARALQSCFTEVEVAQYARKRGVQPDTALLSSADSFDEPMVLGGRPVADTSLAPSRDGSRRAGGWGKGGAREQHPADYTANPDGTWRAPSGRTVRDPDMCRRIQRRRLAAELPIVPDGNTFDLTTLVDTLVKAAVDAEQTPHEWLTAAIKAHAAPPPPPAKLEVARAKRAKPETPGQLELDLGVTTPPRKLRSAA